MKVSVIIVNWNGKKFLKNCLSSVFKQTYKNFEVLMVDNASKNDSVEFVKKNFPNVKVIQNNKNYGFAEGNNIGIRKAKGKYIVLLNNDTIVDRNWLEELVKIADSNKRIGMIAPKTLYMNGKIDTLGLMILKSGLAWDIKDKKDLKWLFCPSGVSALYKKEMLEDIKLDGEYFDKDFFCYSEDLDLGFRARLNGWKCASAPKSVVHHIHGGSTGGISDFAVYYGHRNNIWTILKNYPIRLLLRHLFWIVSAQLILVLVYFIKGKPLLILKSKFSAIAGLPKMLKTRKVIQKNKIATNDEIKNLIYKKFIIF